MKLWRISGYANLSGGGGLKTPGRWHNRGIPIVYLSEHPALALLEVLVHFEIESSDAPDSYQLLEVEVSERKGISQLHESDMPDNWREDIEYTRNVGDEWLSSMGGILLKVPSVIIPESSNYLFNPRHELSSNVKINKKYSHPYDMRLINR